PQPLHTTAAHGRATVQPASAGPNQRRCPRCQAPFGLTTARIKRLAAARPVPAPTSAPKWIAASQEPMTSLLAGHLSHASVDRARPGSPNIPDVDRVVIVER